MGLRPHERPIKASQTCIRITREDFEVLLAGVVQLSTADQRDVNGVVSDLEVEDRMFDIIRKVAKENGYSTGTVGQSGQVLDQP